MLRFPLPWLTLLVFALGPRNVCNAQDSLPVIVGDTVRITAPTLDLDKHSGTVRVMEGDTLIVDSIRVALMSVTLLDIHRGRKSNAGKGFLIGSATTGLILGGLAWLGCADLPAGAGPGCSAAMGFGVGFLAGGLIGAVIGALSPSDRWEEVPLDQIRVTFVPQREGRFALGLSVAF